MWTLSGIPVQHERYFGPDGVFCTLWGLCKATFCWVVRDGLMIPALSQQSPWSPHWLQIWHKELSFPERCQLEADDDIHLFLHLLHPSCLGTTLGCKAQSKHHLLQSSEVACLVQFHPAQITSLVWVPTSLCPSTTSLFYALVVWQVRVYCPVDGEALNMTWEWVLTAPPTHLTHTHSFLHLRAGHCWKAVKYLKPTRRLLIIPVCLSGVQRSVQNRQLGKVMSLVVHVFSDPPGPQKTHVSRSGTGGSFWPLQALRNTWNSLSGHSQN